MSSLTSQYAFSGAGTFSTIQYFDSINFLDASAAFYYDTTGAVEFLVDVAVLNNYIGITKDANYISLTSGTKSSDFYDNVYDTLKQSSLILTSKDIFFDTSNNLSSIEDVGRLKTLYSDFDIYIKGYFGNTGFVNLLNKDYTLNPNNNNVFGPSQLLNILIPNSTDQAILGASISGISGSVSLNNITSILRSATTRNTFNNRNTYYGTTASSTTNRSNYGVTDGFMDGDLLFIPSNGFRATVQLALCSNCTPSDAAKNIQIAQDLSGSLPLNNVYDTSNNLISAGTFPAFSEVTTLSPMLISRLVSVPLLIRLVNMKLPYIIRSMLSSTTTDSITFDFRGSLNSIDISRSILSIDSSGNYQVGSNTSLLTGASVNPIDPSQNALTSYINNINNNLYFRYFDNNLVSKTTYVYTITPHLSTLSITTGYPYNYEYTTK